MIGLFNWLLNKSNDREKIKEWINSVSKDKFTITDDGYLVRDGNAKNGILGTGINRSQEYSDRLQDGIGADGTITIRIAKEMEIEIPPGETGLFPNGTTFNADIDIWYNGGATTPDGKNVYITGNPTSIKMIDGSDEKYNPNRILMHELVSHAIPNTVSSDKRIPGKTLYLENRVNMQMLFWKLRMEVPHPGD
jgi:hypothetical protein